MVDATKSTLDYDLYMIILYELQYTIFDSMLEVNYQLTRSILKRLTDEINS